MWREKLKFEVEFECFAREFRRFSSPRPYFRRVDGAKFQVLCF